MSSSSSNSKAFAIKATKKSSSAKVKPLDVKETGFMHSLLSADCAPQQEIREITENAIQAIEARVQNTAARNKRDRGSQSKPQENQQEKRQDKPQGFVSGEVRWQMYPESQKRYGVPKLCCVDNGEGMSAKELEEYIGRLSSSGRTQSRQGNFGMGAKISALQNNPAGVVYESWQKGVGNRVTLFRDENGIPGLKIVSGQRVVEKISKRDMPDLISKSGGYGTMVILLGHSISESNTFARPDNYEESKKDDWIAWTLNRRYYRIPDSVKIISSPRPSKKPKIWNEVKGIEWFLHNQAKYQGTISVPDGQLHWTLLKHHKAYKALKPYYDSGAKVGALHDGELFEYSSSVAAQNRIQQHFGIPLGANQVALIFDPDDAASNTSRSTITINKKSLPWDEWSKFFRANMPQVIKEHVSQRQGEELEDKGHLKKAVDILGDLGIKRFCVRAPGPRIGGEALQAIGVTVGVKNGVIMKSDDPLPILADIIKTTAPLTALNRSNGGPREGSVLAPGDSYQARQRKIQLERLVPDCTWGKGRDLGMEGLLTRYISEENKLLLNEDAPIIKSMENKWLAKKSEQYKDEVRRKIREHFEVQAVEVVLQAKQLEGSESWEGDIVIDLLEDDRALSLAASGVCHLDSSLTLALRNIPKR